MATIYNLGSINTDHFYRMESFPRAGETLAATAYSRGLGGKGANQSVAMARAGADVRHLGAVGGDGLWMIDRMKAMGVDCTHVQQGDTPSGHAIINIDHHGENTIVLFSGANLAISPGPLRSVLASAQEGDFLVLQNEAGCQVEMARLAHETGLKLVYSAAPFESKAVREVLPYVWLLLLNEVEADQLCAALGSAIDKIPVSHVVVTRGAQGAVWYDNEGQTQTPSKAIKVEAIDTTGAGDTFAGFLISGLAEGLTKEEAMRLASAAASLKVTRAGTADAIPTRDEVDNFLADQPSE
ncbi:ribokinase [Albirhodobacter sp. R86504]|uniref:ribokinase n=1 Tax=Albirhodobacter sp. R86504 TaxID=3093848 RepID=UPI0036723785